MLTDNAQSKTTNSAACPDGHYNQHKLPAGAVACTSQTQSSAHLRCTIALEHLEEDSSTKPKGEAHHQAGPKDIQEAGKDGEDSGALQLDVIAQSLASHSFCYHT